MKTRRGLAAGVLLCVLLHVGARAQYPGDTRFRADIDSIRNITAEAPEKIRQLQVLRAAYLDIHPETGAIYAEIMHRLGDVYAQNGDLVPAAAYTAEAIRVNARSGLRRPFLCNSYYNAGVFYLQLNMLRQSALAFRQCISAGRQFSEKHFIVGMAHTQLAYAAYRSGDYQQAIDIAVAGLPYTRSAGDPVETGALWSQKAQAEIGLQQIGAARKSITTALRLLEGQGGIQQATAFAIYGRLLDVTAQRDKSVGYYRNAIALNERLENYAQAVNDLNDLGNVYRTMGLFERAMHSYAAGLRLTAFTHNPYQAVGLYENMGVACAKKGAVKQALFYYQKALTSLPVGFRGTAVHENPAVDMLGRVSNDYYVSTLLADKAEALTMLYLRNRDKKLLRSALQTLLLADRSVDMMRRKQSAERSKLLWRSETKQMYEQAIDVCYRLNDLEHGFYFFEKSRSVLLNEQLDVLRRPKPAAEQSLVEKFGVKTASFDRRLTARSPGTDTTGIRAEWLNLHQVLENRLNAQRTAEPGETAGQKSPDGLAQVQQYLAANRQSLVEYFNRDSLVYALVITPERASMHRIVYRNYARDTRHFYRLCSDAGLLNRSRQEYATLAGTLCRKLFSPLKIRTERVVISPDEQFIAFDALLRDSKEPGSFLLRQHAFSYVYSMRVLRNHRFATRQQALAFLGIAPEYFARGMWLQPLEGSVASVKRIDDNFTPALLLEGPKATKRRVLERLPQARIVQIYSHARADSLRRDPVLYMADSAISMQEVQKLDCRNTEMVVLSACNTGIGYAAVGEGLFSLARGFRLAGIPCTVTNVWQADNQATYLMTERFYHYLQKGMPKDRALREAKLALFRESPDYVLPYYWAATIVLGESSALQPAGISHRWNDRKWPGIVAGLTAFFTLVFLICTRYRRRKKRR
ncbi:MAG: CHAT domain-containing protein [Mucilaginibacter polytrichastri]|nr:CHAT domain-containing protein [Mucilaginibacter polytrichastri]